MMPDAPQTVSAAFDRAVAEWGSRPFLDRGDRWATYGEVAAEVTDIAAGMAVHGVQTGSRVALALAGSDAVAAWLAADRLGAVSIPAPAGAASDAMTTLTERYLPDLVVADLTGLRSGASTEAALSRRGRPSDVALIHSMDGPDGTVRGCLLTQRQLIHAATQMLELTGRAPDEVYWCALPALEPETLVTIVVPSLLIGGPVSVADAFRPQALWAEIHRTGARFAALTGRMMAALALRAETREELCCRGQLRAVTGGCPPADLQDLWSARFGVETPGLPYYWRCEAGILAGVRCGEYAPAGSCGRRLSDYDVRILDEEDDEVPGGAAGEIVCRPRVPHTVFRGYWNQPEATVAATANLWFHTGDLGVMDEDGFLFLDRDRASADLDRPGSGVVRYM